MKSMGRHFGVFVLAGILLIALTAVQTVAAAEVQRYVMGSGPMGGPWKIGVGAGVQLINEQLKDKYFFTAAASGGLGGEHAAPGRRRVRHDLDPGRQHVRGLDGDGALRGQAALQGDADDGVPDRPGPEHRRPGQVADQDPLGLGGQKGQHGAGGERLGRHHQDDDEIAGDREQGQGQLSEFRGGGPGPEGRPDSTPPSARADPSRPRRSWRSPAPSRSACSSPIRRRPRRSWRRSPTSTSG